MLNSLLVYLLLALLDYISTHILINVFLLNLTMGNQEGDMSRSQHSKVEPMNFARDEFDSQPERPFLVRGVRKRLKEEPPDHMEEIVDSLLERGSMPD